MNECSGILSYFIRCDIVIVNVATTTMYIRFQQF